MSSNQMESMEATLINSPSTTSSKRRGQEVDNLLLITFKATVQRLLEQQLNTHQIREELTPNHQVIIIS